MSTFFRADAIKNVCLTEDTISVILLDGRTITVPLTRYPKLFSATPEQRAAWSICGGGYGIYWEEINEDLSTERRIVCRI